MRCRILPGLILVWVTALTTLWSHEIRPAYLQVDETSPGSYDVLWKIPRIGERVPDIKPDFADDFVLEEGDGGALLDGFVVYHYRLTAERPLAGTTLSIDGLPRTTIDVLANLNALDGRKQTLLLHPTSPSATFAQNPSKWGVAATYTKLGIEHILLGIDHLLFVLALILIIDGRRKLVGTITAFTLAHSITLGLATLGYISLPGPPVEAVIALSIALVAVDILRKRRGANPATSRWPWMVAFVFGLLHGFGFAGALGDIGLPQQAVPLALLFFNVGVEAGQLLFIAAVLLLAAGFKRLPLRLPEWTKSIPPYAIGSLAMFWVIERSWSYTFGWFNP
ncbi:HupE/UreJ family protein [Luteolibacter marinus]|uniref:HupE/UreJ family protein n=1 Tax=Luteolibacter marinus TaxID=2776705 RepID=UPI001866314A|nr:HupE/UreJ family protein [Luteolibacter marinus]